MNSVSVECKALCAAYGRTEVLKGVELRIEPGEFFALLGPSGSGKSTLLRLMAGFVPASSGQLLIDGREVAALEPWQRNVGLVFQNYALWPHLSVHDNVAFGLVERKRPKADIAQRVATALELVGLGGYAQRRPGQLSGGQQQRVALARTLVTEPQVLLLDEPMSNLDKALRVQMRGELLALQRRLGLTTVFVTHDQEEAMTTADRMAVLNHGVLQQVGTPQQLYDHPANAFVAGFVGTMNLLPATVRAFSAGLATVEVAGLGMLPVAHAAPLGVGDALQLCLRPQALSQASGSAVWQGLVGAREFLGTHTRLHVQVQGHSLVADVPHPSRQALPAVGEAVALQVDLAQARLLVG